MKARDVKCPSCRAEPGEPCRPRIGETMADSAAKPRTGRFHRTRTKSASLKTQADKAFARKEARAAAEACAELRRKLEAESHYMPINSGVPRQSISSLTFIHNPEDPPCNGCPNPLCSDHDLCNRKRT